MFFVCQCYSFFKGHVLPEVNTCDFFDRIHHVNPFEWFIDFDFCSLVVDWTITMDSFRSMLDDTFCQVHDIVEISVSLIHFDRSEFRVVSSIHSLVTENPSDFVNTFHPTNNQTFQVELSRDTKHHINVLRIVVSDKWFSSCTTSFIVKHWCFHFKESLTI